MLNAQSETQLSSELKKRGINTMSEVNEALKAQGMTEMEARKMASVYGINYDDYIAKYILGDDSMSGSTLSESVDNSVTETITTISYDVDPVFEKIPSVSAPKINPNFFGYEIFQNNPFANKDYLIGNIDENYILGPGDEIRIYVWGSHAYQAQVKIDLNGNVILPDNGVFFASGYTFETLKKKLKRYLGKSYSGLITSPQTSFIDVSLTQLRPVSITVLGESNTPGPHLVNGFATVLNALYASGGVKTSGSLREIKIYRKNKLIKTVDLYDYITTGALTEDIRLMNNDVIFIPIRNNSISLTGSVKKTGIFELKDDEGLNELVGFAGGFKSDASLKNIKLNRIKPFEERLENDVYHRFISSINLDDLKALNKNFKLYDGDEITINSVLGKVLNQVSISGPVKRPGNYALSEFQDLNSLIILAADSLLPRVYMDRIHLYRSNEDGTRNFFSFNLKNVLDGIENFDLQNEDRVVLFDLNHTEGDDRTITISGYGANTGKYNWNKDMTIYDLIFNTVSINDKDFQARVLDSRIDLNRYNSETGMYYKKSYNLLDILSKEKNETLLPRDQILLYAKGINEVIDKEVTIKGYVKNPGKHILTENMVVEDLILLSGGFKEYANQETVIVSRPKYDLDLGIISESIYVDLDIDYLLGKKKNIDSSAFYLQHRDLVNVRLISGYEPMKSISIFGEVRFPGVISLTNKKQTLKDVLKSVGGVSPFASLEASYILRENEIFILNMKKALKNDVAFLENGDEIFIGSKTGTVDISGAVLNEGLFVWEKRKRTKNYIRKSGSYSGKIDHVIVKHPNGITKKKRWFNNPKVAPNSEIIVFAKPEKEKKNNSERLDKFIQVLTILTGSLTTIVLTRAL